MCNASLDEAADEEEEDEEEEADLEDVQDELPVIQDTRIPIQFCLKICARKKMGERR